MYSLASSFAKEAPFFANLFTSFHLCRMWIQTRCFYTKRSVIPHWFNWSWETAFLSLKRSNHRFFCQRTTLLKTNIAIIALEKKIIPKKRKKTSRSNCPTINFQVLQIFVSGRNSVAVPGACSEKFSGFIQPRRQPAFPVFFQSTKVRVGKNPMGKNPPSPPQKKSLLESL